MRKYLFVNIEDVRNLGQLYEARVMNFVRAENEIIAVQKFSEFYRINLNFVWEKYQVIDVTSIKEIE